MLDATGSTFISVCNAAALAHEANRIYCIALGDQSQVSWAEAPRWQQESAINGILSIIDNPSITPEDLHKKWMAEKVSLGWVYGEKKDPEAKTHPCLVAYADLPEEQRAKDVIFQTIARAALKPILEKQSAGASA